MKTRFNISGVLEVEHDGTHFCANDYQLGVLKEQIGLLFGLGLDSFEGTDIQADWRDCWVDGGSDANTELPKVELEIKSVSRVEERPPGKTLLNRKPVRIGRAGEVDPVAIIQRQIKAGQL